MTNTKASPAVLKNDNYRITSEGKQGADAFLSWLRKNGQDYQEQVSIILSGSVGLDAQANIYSPFDLKTAVSCLEELSATYRIALPLDVRQSMYRKTSREHVLIS